MLEKESLNKKLIAAIDSLRGKKLLVVGDVGIDEYVTGHVKRISPEAPVPIVEVDHESHCLGLASNVAANIASLGATALLVGVIGEDQTGEAFKKLLLNHHCTSDHLIMDKDRPTTRKLRVMAGHHHIVRVDFERKKFLSSEMESKLIAKISELIPTSDGVIIEDYAKGVLSQNVIQETIALAKKYGKLTTLDPNRMTPIEYYKGVDYLTPNTEEAIALSELKSDELRTEERFLEKLGSDLLNKTHSKGVIITRGKDGMSAFLKGAASGGEHFPTFARSVFDVTGAGDTVIATFTLALAEGLSVKEACLLSNFAAGIVVAKAGCVTASPEELKDYILQH
jgi:rfaE bifunctional protein kinase chain/domain